MLQARCSFQFFVLFGSDNLNRGCWNADPPLPYSPFQLLTAIFPQWHLPCVCLKKHQQDNMFKRHEGKQYCSGDQSDCNFVCSLKAGSFQCQKVRTTKDGLKEKEA